MSSVDSKKLISYCFMATLNNKDSDLFTSVYLPIAQRALSQYSLTQSSGFDKDLRDKIAELYGLNVPIFTIRQMLKVLEKKLSKKERKQNGFVVLDHGKSFQIHNYEFATLEEAYQRDESSAKVLDNAFLAFLANKNVLPSSCPSFLAFFENNKNEAIKFLTLNQPGLLPALAQNHDYLYHAEFLTHIRNNNESLFDIAKKLYIGSVVATYLESGVNLDEKYSKNEEYFIDTQLILKALDLQDEDETEPARELLKIIASSESRLKVLDISLEEIDHGISKAIEHFDDFITTVIRNSSINYACYRRSISKTELQSIQSNLEKMLYDKFEIEVENIPKSVKQQAEKHPDTEELDRTRHNPGSGLHDVAAYLYIREKRGRPVSTPQKAKYWFLSPNKSLYRFNRTRTSKNYLPEIITPETLTSLLWLKSPKMLSGDAAKIGVSKLISLAHSEALPTAETLLALESNLKRHLSCTPQDFSLLVAGLASVSSERVHKLNDLASSDKDEFTQQVVKLIHIEKEKKEYDLEYSNKLKARVDENEEEKRGLSVRNSQLVEELRKYESIAAASSHELSLEKESKIDLLRKNNNLQRLYLIVGACASFGSVYLSYVIYEWNKKLSWGLATFAAIILLITVYLFRNKIQRWVSYSLTVLISLGGLWSFGNFMLNLFKALFSGSK